MRNLFLLILLNTFTYSEAAVLSILPNNTNIFQGDSVAVDIVISDLGNISSPSASAFQMNLEYDPDILKPSNIGFSNQLNNGNVDSSIQRNDTSSAGTIKLSEVSFLEGNSGECVFCSGPYLDDFQSDSFTLATVTFVAEKEGISDLGFSNVEFTGSNLSATPLNVDLNMGSITVAPATIPLPPSVILFLTGIIMIPLKAKHKNP
jgi:hypothetical protein